MATRGEWVVVGISGVTCGGKTTLANRLLRAVSGARVIHQDKYFYPDTHPAHRPVPGLSRPHNNYDVLSALDMQQMYNDVLSTMEGMDKSHARGPAGGGGGGGGGGALRLEGGRQLLVLEGFTALNYRPLFELCDLRYYLVLEYGECVSRRVLRQYSPPDVPGYFELAVWPAHTLYRAEMEKEADVKFLDGTDPDAFDKVVADLKRLGATEVPRG